METCANVMTSLALKIKANCVEVRISTGKQGIVSHAPYYMNHCLAFDA